MAFSVDKNVPLIDAKSGGRKYPFSEMSVGDSFLVSPEESGIAEMSIRAAARMYGMRNKMKFTCRIVDGGIRVWRIK